MNIEETLEQVGGQADKTIKQGKDLYERALERTKEGAGTVDRLLHRNTYNVLAAGIAAGFAVGILVARGCRCAKG